MSQASNFNNKDTPLISNGLFEIVFDLPTPRPHFILKFCQDNRKSNLKDLNDNDLLTIFSLINSFADRFGLKSRDLILSFHTGYWANTPAFHCHICCNIDDYIRIFNGYDNLNFVENFKPTKQWVIKSPNGNQTMKDVYLANVNKYKEKSSKSSNKYRLKEIKNAEQISNFKTVGINDPNFQLNFDLREPRLHFISAGIIDNVRLLKLMREFANKEGYFNRNSGSHICVILDFNNNPSSGYIQVGGDVFYQMHPNRDAFLTNFKNHQGYCKDT